MRTKEISERELEIEKVKQERRELCIKDQNINVPMQQALKASGDREALKTFKKERKPILREIDRRSNHVWHLEWKNQLIEKLEGDALIAHYFPKLYFDEQYVLD